MNGYAGGYGMQEILMEELSSLGLSGAEENRLLEIADRGFAPGCPVP